MKDTYDIVVAGGGPAGSAAAWRAAKEGASVLVCDRARFPRDKPCGDGLSGRALLWVDRMGLSDSIARFPRIDQFSVHWRDSSFSGPVPTWRDGRPPFARVVPRTEFDELLLRNAESVGAEVIECADVRGPIVRDGLVTGVEVALPGRNQLKSIRAGVTIGCDGMSSRVGRSLGMTPRESHPFGVVVRAQIDSNNTVDDRVHFWILEADDEPIAGYGWVFPMGEGRLNVGVGYSSKQRGSERINIRHLFQAFVSRLRDVWSVPSFEEMAASGGLRGWRLPMGMAVWPPWRPGVLLAGDAAGVAEPYAGAGISRALESGVAAGAFAAAAIEAGSESDLSGYARWLHQSWSGQYRIGRGVHSLFAHPRLLRGLMTTSVSLGRLPRVLWHLGTDSFSGGDRGSQAAARALLWAGAHLPGGDDPEIAIEAAVDDKRTRAFRRPPARV